MQEALGQVLTLVCQHFHEERVLLPAVNNVRGRHPLSEAPCAALHSAVSPHLAFTIQAA